ncbi:helix-turn-helix transcriptional regulator [Pedobacter caeni]|uniref:Transcriptional regulator, AraC family n=1 Tax=Pedobacter caeni TaxID=288992 RepID=A0A1M4WBV4_9SPHI|nr:AraC family transcriptional regulator [Pedobacter caeni]SHE78761.1 transcriptional regulator, AraC family [Pedobacter caeni]
MEARIQTLYDSEICVVHNFLCRCVNCTVSDKEHQDNFVIAYIRTGNFQFKVFRNNLDAYHGFFLINKPGYEYRVGHDHKFPDECTIFTISEHSLAQLKEQVGALSWFFGNPDIQSVLVKATPETEYLHHCIFQLLQTARLPRLWVETLMTELFVQVLLTHEKPALPPLLTVKQKKNYLPTIETVKQFINENFTADLSLSELAELGYLSPFHFNRLFKQITTVSPYQYLLRVRLKHAHLQLCNTSTPVSDIAFLAGFNSLVHFSAAYKKMYGMPPSSARK